MFGNFQLLPGTLRLQQEWTSLTLRLALHTTLTALKPPPKSRAKMRSPLRTPPCDSIVARVYLVFKTAAIQRRFPEAWWLATLLSCLTVILHRA